MKTHPSPLRAATFALLVAVSSSAYVACGSDSGTETTGNPQPVGSSSSSSGSASSSSGAGGAGSTSSSTSTSSSSGTGGTGTGGAGGCFAGTPTTPEQFLDACNGLTCNAFDNKARLPLLNADGSLPALP